MEHHSNIVPWHFLRERKGAVIKWAPVDDDGNFLDRRIREAAHAAHEDRRHHAHVERARHGDADRGDHPHRACARRAGAGRRQPGRRASRTSTCGSSTADFYVFTGHKVYGPTGIGVLYGKREWLERLPPYQGGGEMIQTVARGRGHLRRPAAPLRGRHAADRRGDRARRGARLHEARRPRRHPRRTRRRSRAYAHERLGAMNSLRIIGTAPGKGAISPSR